MRLQILTPFRRKTLHQIASAVGTLNTTLAVGETSQQKNKQISAVHS